MLRLTALLLLSATGHCFQLSHVPRTPALRSRPILASVAEQPPPPDESEEEKRARLARCTEARTPDLCATACVHAMGSVPVQEAIGREAAAEKNYLDSAPADDGGLMAEFQARIDAEGGANVFKAKSAANDVTEQAKEAANKAKARDRPDCRAHGMLAAPPPPRWPTLRPSDPHTTCPWLHIERVARQPLFDACRAGCCERGGGLGQGLGERLHTAAARHRPGHLRPHRLPDPRRLHRQRHVRWRRRHGWRAHRLHRMSG